jgi:hypothetical protein
VVAKLDVAVKQEWFDVYRTAREGLVAAIPALGDDRDPQPSSALARLRHLRTELLARYGAGETVNPSAGQREGMAQAQRVPADQPPAVPPRPSAIPRVLPRSVPAAPVVAAGPRAASAAPAPVAPAAEPDAVPIESLEYGGNAALEHALTLRPALEQAVRHDRDAGAQLEELFDLIRLALG